MTHEKNKIRRDIFQQGFGFVAAILVAILFGLAILLLDGAHTADILRSAASSTFSSSFRFANMISRLVLIVLVALAAAIPFKAGIWNIGGDGQLLVGALSTALAGVYITGLPAVLHVFICVLAGMAGGALWALLPTVLRLRYNANEIVTTIMMNYLATLFTNYMVNYPFRAAGAANAETALIQKSAYLKQLVPLSNLSTGAFIALAVFLVIWFLDAKTSWGYEWKVLGANEEFARYGGVRDKQKRLLSMLIGGALAGLAGTILVLGVNHKFQAGLGGGIGFTGVLIAIIATNSPVLILVVSAIFALIQSSMIGLEAKLGIAPEFNDILQSVIILVVIIRSRIGASISKLFTGRKNYGNSR